MHKRMEENVGGQEGLEVENSPEGGEELESPQPEDKGEETPQGEKVSIAGKEYTLEELQQLAQKADQYDQLLPDYTRKAQELAKHNKPPEQKDIAPYEKEDWVPKDYKELAQAFRVAEERGMKRALGTLEGQQRQSQEIKEGVEQFVETAKQEFEAFDEEDFFDYVNRHKFPVNTVQDLYSVFSAYKEQGNNVPTRRRTERVSAPKVGGNSTGPNLSDLRGSNILDGALEAYRRLTNK